MTSEEKISKLESEIQHARTQKQKCISLNDLAMELRNADPSAALFRAEEALRIAEEINFTQGKARSYFCSGLVYFNRSAYEQAFVFLDRAYQNFIEASDQWGISNALNNLGLIHLRLGDYSKALENFSSSLRIKKESRDHFGTANVMISMANIHRETGNLSDARLLLDESLKIAEELKSDALLSKGLIELGVIHLMQSEFGAATDKFNEARRLFEKEKNAPGIAQCFLHLGKVKSESDETQLAISLFEQGLQIAEEAGGMSLVAQFLYNIAAEKLKSNDLYEATSILQRARELVIKTQEKPMLAIIAQQLSNAYEATGNLSSALIEFKNFIALKDEINAADTATRLQNQQISARVESLEKENKMLEVEKMAAIGQLTAGVAHEINNPVNFIASNISPVRKNITDIIMLLQQYEIALKDDPGNEALKNLRQSLEIDFAIDETGELLKGIESGAHRIREIVNALRVITRLDEESFKAADVHEEIDAVLLMLQNKTSAGINIKKEFGEVNPFEHFPALMSQALMNVLQNAIEATPTGGEVTIKTYEEDHTVYIIIADSGKGMSEKLKRKIFDPFFTTKDVGAGFGLGLSVARSIVEQHRGTIELESEPGKGTVVKMILPVR